MACRSTPYLIVTELNRALRKEWGGLTIVKSREVLAKLLQTDSPSLDGRTLWGLKGLGYG